MPFRRLAQAVACACIFPAMALAQAADEPTGLMLELNTLQDTGNACRLTFLVQNGTGTAIEKAVFETVIFDTSGGVVSLSLFDFRDLPPDRPRVRQFDLPGQDCNAVGRALINGAHSCVVDGAESGICADGLSLRSRSDVELLG